MQQGIDINKLTDRFFESIEPLKLKTWSVKEKNRALIAQRMIEYFEFDKQYSEFDVNAILADIAHDDYVTIRRYLVDMGYLSREKDCSAYWRVVREPEGQE